MNRIVFCTFYDDYFFANKHQSIRLAGPKVGRIVHDPLNASCDHPLNRRLLDAINRRQREQRIEESSFTPMDDRDFRSPFRTVEYFGEESSTTVRPRWDWYADWGI